LAFAQQTTAQANAEETQLKAKIALARQLAAQAQFVNGTRNSKQMTAVLLAVRSMQVFPLAEAAQILQNNSLGRPIARISHEEGVTSLALSQDGKHVVSGSYDHTARVWEAATGKEISRMIHDSPVLSVDFSSDGRYVVSLGYLLPTCRVNEG